MKENEFVDKIDDYLLSRLDDQSEKNFLQAIENDAELAKTVRLREVVLEGVEAFGRNEMKAQLKTIHQEVMEPARVIPMKSRKLLPYIAAVASVLIIVFAIFKMNTSTIDRSSSELYASYFEPYDISGMQRSSGDGTMLQVEELYKNQKYAEVLPLLETQLNELTVKPSHLLLAKGIAHLELNQPEKALAEFELVTANKDFNFEDEISWYSALAYLKLDDQINAKTFLKKLSVNPKADHHKEAKQLLGEF